MNTKFWNKNTKTLVPYVPGEQPKHKCIKLNTNECPYPPSIKVKEALESFDYEMLRLYPDPSSSKLKDGLCEYYGLDMDEIFLGNGSDEVLAFAFQAFFDAESKAAFPNITYSFYPVYASLYSVETCIIPLLDDFTLDIEAMKNYDGGLVIANPNAPTGIAISLTEIKEILESNANRLVIIDEAYIDFGGETAISLIKEYDNLMVIQTVSKSRALAGLRVGYAIANPSLIKALECIRDSFNSYTMDSIAQSLALVSIQDGAWFERTRALIMETREWFINEILALGFITLPSKANFIFTTHPKSCASELYAQLKEKGILVRYFNKPLIDNYLRISIGTKEEMQILLNALTEILK